MLARKLAAGEIHTKWFEWLHAEPITEVPVEWPDVYRQLVHRRIALIERDPNIRLIEQTISKRRWENEPWESQLERALGEWLLDRLESYFDFDRRMKVVSDQVSAVSGATADGSLPPTDSDRLSTDSISRAPLVDIQLLSTAKLADAARHDREFVQVGELYRNRSDFDVEKLVAELVEAESVPLLPVLRYKPSGLDKRSAWERTWDLQRRRTS